MSIATAVAARVGELRASRSVHPPREITVSRTIHAPLPIVRECCWDAARHEAVHALGAARLEPDAVRGTIVVGPFRHGYRAAIAGGPDSLRWRGRASAGAVRFVRIDRETTRVEVVLRWTPSAAWAHVAAGIDLDRRQIAAELHRLALIAESEAAEARLGPISV